MNTSISAALVLQRKNKARKIKSLDASILSMGVKSVKEKTNENKKRILL